MPNRGATFDELDGLTVTLGDITEGGWWFNLRSSNTEPLLRLNLEAAGRSRCATSIWPRFKRFWARNRRRVIDCV